MDAIWDSGNEFILFLQSLGEWLTPPMEFFTFLGNEYFYLFVAPLIFWCIDMKLGLRLGLRLMVCATTNQVIKMVFQLIFWRSLI